MRCGLTSVLGLMLACIMVVPSAEPAERKNRTDPIQISISRALFGGVPDNLALAAMQPFGGLMEAQTGLNGQMSVSENPFELAQRLAKNHVQIGVFEGVEFAWVRETQQDLRPLAISVNQEHVLKACVVVRARAGTEMNDLKGKVAAIPARTRQHCLLFLAGLCQRQDGSNLDRFFARITRPESAEETLDDLVDRKVDVAVVDHIALEAYQRTKPGRFQQLQLLKQSEDFPASVVVYCRGRFDETMLGKFRESLLSAHKSAVGRHLLTMWKLTSFEEVPRDYDKMLASIAKSYPPPARP